MNLFMPTKKHDNTSSDDVEPGLLLSHHAAESPVYELPLASSHGRVARLHVR